MLAVLPCCMRFLFASATFLLTAMGGHPGPEHEGSCLMFASAMSVYPLLSRIALASILRCALCLPASAFAALSAFFAAFLASFSCLLFSLVFDA